MSIEGGQLKQRVFSAKPASFHQTLVRPVSGMPSHSFSRKELIQNVYTMQSQMLPLRTASAKAMNSRTLASLEKSKKIVVKQSRRKEELQQEILKLKQTINELTDKLCQQKGKTESMRKKGHKLSKMLSIQFQNESHWNSSALNGHLVAGIKNTYECLKEKYEMLQEEHSLLLKRQNITNELQYITYIDILEKENKTLTLKLARTADTIAPNVASFIISELQTECQNIAEKYTQVEGRYQMCVETLKDRNKKIEFLEKIIIEKDNHLHTVERQAKKLREQIFTLREINSTLQHNLKKQFETQQRYIKKLQFKLQQQKDYYERVILEEVTSKESKIREMERESSYLKEMIDQLRRTNTEFHQFMQDGRSKSRGTNQLVLHQEKKKNQTAPIFSKNTTNEQCQINYIGEHYQTISQHSNRNESFSGLFVNGKRIPQKADIKYHEHAVKKRKTSIEQVAELAELVKLKLIHNKFPFAKVKSLFEVDSNNKKGEWEQEYITMREANHILTFPPFSLPPEKAELLARYLIEDVQTDFVYCDDFNENTRQIVKSILKALLKDYPVCMPNSHLQSDVKKFMQNYEANLKSALLKIQPSGKISKKKFLQTLNNLNMLCSQDVEYVLLGKMGEKASNINQLNYKALFH